MNAHPLQPDLLQAVRAFGHHCRTAPDGPEALRSITAFDDREHLLAGMAAGADDFERKP